MVEEKKTESNPFASPSVSGTEGEFHPCPLLPLVFRPSIFSFVVAIPFGLILLLATVMALFSMFNPTGELRAVLFSFLIAVTAGIGAVGCLGVCWVKVIVTEESFRKVDFSPRTVRFDEIAQWNSKGNYVIVSFKSDSRKVLQVHNWAMSRRNCRVLAGVLYHKVGPSEAKW